MAALLAALMIVLVAAFGYWGTYTRKATVKGLLMPEHGMLRLTAPVAGLIKEVREP